MGVSDLDVHGCIVCHDLGKRGRSMQVAAVIELTITYAYLGNAVLER